MKGIFCKICKLQIQGGRAEFLKHEKNINHKRI